MENAASALKMAAAIFVFIVGLSILFNMTSLARDTATIVISKADKTNYYEYYEGNEAEMDAKGNRIVSFDSIIPVLYRYSLENYGVTIVNKDGEIVARFDLDTEVMCNNWLTASANNKYRFVSETDKVYDRLNNLAGERLIRDTTFNLTVDDITNVQRDDPNDPTLITYAELKDNVNNRIINFFKNHYKQYANSGGLVRREYYCYWAANKNCVAQRVDSDLSRN